MTASLSDSSVVSVALATYNGAAFVDAQLRSLADQTRLPDEVIVTDDGSTDGTVGIVEAFAETAPFPVRISVNERRLGYTRNFGEAMRRCRGDVVFLCDQDDVWFPQKIKRIMRVFAEHPGDHVVIHDGVVTDQALGHRGATTLGNLRRIGQSDAGFVTGCCTAVRRPFLDAVLPIPDTVRGHDSWIHHLALLLDVRNVLPEPLLYYRRHGDTVSTTPTLSVMPVRGISGRLRATAHKIRRVARHSHADAVVETEAGWRSSVDRLVAMREEPGRRAGVSSSSLSLAEVRARAMLLACGARAETMALPRCKRPPRVLAGLAAGHYRGFDVPGAPLLDLFAAPLTGNRK